MISWMLLQLSGNGYINCNCLFITNASTLGNSTYPWNTTPSSNPMDFPAMISNNIPWAWPLIFLVLMVVTDYQLGIKRGVDTKNNLFASALAYTVVNYIGVYGKLEPVGYFYGFELLMVIVLLIMTLLPKQGE